MVLSHIRTSALLLLLAATTPVRPAAGQRTSSPHGAPHASATNAGQTSVSTASTPPNIVGRLDMLARLQAAAVQSGDPVQIATASRELNAELLRLLGTIAAGENRTGEGIELYRESLGLHPDTDVALLLAKLLARAGQTAEAVRVAETVTGADPQNARGWTTLASVLRAEHRDAEAVAPLEKALELDSQPAIALALGSAMLGAHDKAHAQEVFQRLLTATNDAALWHVAIGDAYREADDPVDAIPEFQKALAKDPRAPHAELFLGVANLQIHEWGPNPESYAHLRKAVEQNPREYLSNFYLGALESTDGRDLAASDRHLHIAAEADPNEPEVWIYLGQNANRAHRNDEAIADFRKAIQLTGSDESQNHFQIRRAYFSLGRLLIATGKREEGERYLEDYRRTGPADAALATASIGQKRDRMDGSVADADASDSLHYLSGEATAKQAAADVAAATTATGAEPSAVSPQLRSAEAQLRTMLRNGYNDLGTAEAQQQEYASALHDFQQAERFGDASPSLLHNLAIAAYRVNDSQEVARALTEYFGATPSPVDPRGRLMLAIANFDLGHFAEAAHDFQAAGNAALGDPRTMYSYALSLARAGQAQEANTLADRLVAGGNLQPDKLALVCNVYFLAENYESSRNCYTKAAQQDPTLLRAHYFVGESLIHLDRPAEAIPALQAELALSPGEPNVESSLAFALGQTGHKDEAMTLLSKTVSAHPENAEAQYQLGKLLAEQGKTSEALPHLQASVEHDSSKDYAHYQLATALRKVGRTADAEHEFAVYRQIKDQHRNDRAAPKGAQPERQTP